MIYLIDTSTLIRAKDAWYPMHRFYQIWSWFEEKAREGSIKVPREIIGEITEGNDELTAWIIKHKKILTIDETTDLVPDILDKGYLFGDRNPTEKDVKEIGRDPILVNYAMNDIKNRTVVSYETSNPEGIRRKSKLPNVCERLGLNHCYMGSLLEALNFIEK